VTVQPTIVGQQREDGTGRHEAAYSRPHYRAPSAGIPAGAAIGGSRAAGNSDGMPRHTAADTTAPDGRWTLRWCEHSMGGRLDDENLSARTHGVEQGRI
jgi:hypothetical protein